MVIVTAVDMVIVVVLVVVLMMSLDAAFCVDVVCVAFMDFTLRTTCSTLVAVAMDADIADDALDVFATFMAGTAQSGKRRGNRLIVSPLSCCPLTA